MIFVDLMNAATIWESAAINIFASVLVLSCMGIVISRLIRFAPALRESMLLAALLACGFVPMMVLVLTFIGRPVFVFTMSPTTEVSAAKSAPLTPDIEPQAALSERSVDVMIDQMLRQPLEASTGDNDTDVGPVSPSVQPAVPASIPMESSTWSSPIRIGGMLLTTWGIGVLALSVVTMRGIRLAWRIRKRAECLSDPRLQILAEQAAETVNLQQLPQILQSNEVSAPIVMGCRQPAILLPPWVCDEIPDPDLRDILIHKFAHVLRGDTGTIYVQAFVRCLFWPIVTIHWLNRELSLAREEVCDNFVLAHDGAASYGQLLLMLAKQAVEPHRMSGTIGLLNWTGELERRVVSIFDVRTNRTATVSRPIRMAFVLLFLMAGITLCGTRFTATQQKSDVAMEINPLRLPRVF